MEQQGPRKIKVQVKDKRRVPPADGPPPRDAGTDGSPPRDAGTDGSPRRDVGTDGSPRRDVGTDEEAQTTDGAAPAEAAEPATVEAAVAGTPAAVEGVGDPAPGGAGQAEYLADLQRLQAEFSNYRKRMMRETAEASARGAERLVGQLLPVLDNFERAIAHGEGGEGVELVFKELKAVLENAGLEEVPGEGAPFDPQVHEGVESREDGSVAEEVVRAVHRRGYTMNGKLLRAAMVGIARPVAAEPEPTPEAEASEGAGQEE